MKKKIYLAGPLFSLAEIEFNEKLEKDLMKIGYSVFLPQRECKGLEDDTLNIFKRCKEGIDSSDMVMATLDGADADSGTCWECGYAYATGKTVLGLRTDFRKSGDTGGFNAMLYHSAKECFDTIDKLLNYLKK